MIHRSHGQTEDTGLYLKFFIATRTIEIRHFYYRPLALEPIYSTSRSVSPSPEKRENALSKPLPTKNKPNPTIQQAMLVSRRAAQGEDESGGAAAIAALIYK